MHYIHEILNDTFKLIRDSYSTKLKTDSDQEPVGNLSVNLHAILSTIIEHGENGEELW